MEKGRREKGYTWICAYIYRIEEATKQKHALIQCDYSCTRHKPEWVGRWFREFQQICTLKKFSLQCFMIFPGRIFCLFNFFPVSNHDLNLQFCWPTSLLPIYIKKRTIGFRLEVDIEWYSKCNRLYKNVLITRRVSYCGMKRNWFAIQLIIILFTFSRLNQHIFRLGRST